MAVLNYHHLRYFREVASARTLGEAAAKLNVSQSALSSQIRQLEDRLGHELFERVGRKLELTEAGRIALDYAERIFPVGDELVATLQDAGRITRPLRVGALSTLSRNFQLKFLEPLFATDSIGLELKSGSNAAMLGELAAQTLDVVLTTELPPTDTGLPFAAQRIAKQPVGLHGHSRFMAHDSLSALLQHEPLILPVDSVIASAFESLTARLQVEAKIIASVDDMAMVRLLAREGLGIAVAPAVVLADEINTGMVSTAPFDLGIDEPFFAVTLPRRFPHPALRVLIDGQAVLKG